MPPCKKKWPDNRIRRLLAPLPRREEGPRPSSLRSSPTPDSCPRFSSRFTFTAMQWPCPAQFSATFQSAEATKMSFFIFTLLINSLQHFYPTFSTIFSIGRAGRRQAEIEPSQVFPSFYSFVTRSYENFRPGGAPGRPVAMFMPWKKEAY